MHGRPTSRASRDGAYWRVDGGSGDAGEELRHDGGAELNPATTAADDWISWHGGWTALPPRDRRIVEWLVSGDVITAQLAALLAYGGLRIAQRRLKKLADYGLIRGFWAANSQRPRGRYAYALTRPTRKDIEQLMWGGRRPRAADVEAPSPVIHQLATHDLLAAFLRASPLGDGIGLAGWAPERATALAFGGFLRPDALAVIG